MTEETWEVEGNFEEQVELSSLENIQSNGISIRVGGQIIKFVADEVQDIGVEEEVRNELREQYNTEADNLRTQFDQFREAVQSQVNDRNRELDRRENELQEQIRNNRSLPVLQREHLEAGLSVAAGPSDGYTWQMICVYAPKYINNKVIDPNFAKRLMTPIRIFVRTNSDWKVTEIRLVKLINCEKFQHYHSMSSNRDCWGGMKYEGELVDTADKALRFMRDVQLVLESINGASIGNRSPRGLSRLQTLEKHLLNERPDPQNNKRDSDGATRRADRAGFDGNVNEEVSESLWDATS